MSSRSNLFAVPIIVLTVGYPVLVVIAASSYTEAFAERGSSLVRRLHQPGWSGPTNGVGTHRRNRRSRHFEIVSYTSVIAKSLDDDSDYGKEARLVSSASDLLSPTLSSMAASSTGMIPSLHEKEGPMDDEAAAPSGTALTGTVNERLLVELQEAVKQEKFGTNNKMTERLRQFSFRSSKTEEERQAAIAEARDLNGVNPIVALLGSIFALACAYGLWILTNTLAEYFAMHPIESDVFFVTRVSAVARNIVMGLVSLASGFFGVTGLGILLLSIRVAYGVVTGELDPTPIVKPVQTILSTNNKSLDVQNVLDLMLNKKNKRGQR